MKKSEVFVLVPRCLEHIWAGLSCSDSRFASWISAYQGCSGRTQYFIHSYSQHLHILLGLTATANGT